MQRRVVGEPNAAGRRAARAARENAAVEISRFIGEITVAGRDLVLLVVVRADDHVAAIAGRTPGDADGMPLAVAFTRDTVVVGEFQALDVLARYEIDHAADRIRAVDRAGAFLQHVHALDEVDRKQVDVHGAVVRDAGHAPAIQQHQRALLTQPPQLDRRSAVAAAVVD